ncbi:monocarboxylate transporter 12-like [Amphiura filiformis]|uniref:monocarboxylate transporter 12-like n=1 Tax=Amphiura filiformis TaxID=82378 RepID=UPI003B215C15
MSYTISSGKKYIFGNILNNTFSPRIAMMTYGLLSSIGFMVGYLAGTLPLLVISIMLIGFTFGAEAITTAALPLYFGRYYDLANAITHAGLSIGLIILPPLTQFLLDTYGWRGTLLVLGALNLNLVVSGALLRPLQTRVTRSLYKTDRDYHSINGRSFTSIQKQLTDISKVMSIIKLMDLDLFLNFDFITLCCIYTATGYFFTGWVIYFVPHCQNIGFSPHESAFLATMGGVGNLIGTIVFPIVAKYLSGKVILYVSAIITALGLVMDPVMAAFHSYIGIMMSSFAVNFGYAVTDCCMFKELVAVVEEKKFSTAVNVLFVGYSIGSMSSGFLSGKKVRARLWPVYRRDSACSGDICCNE